MVIDISLIHLGCHHKLPTNHIMNTEKKKTQSLLGKADLLQIRNCRRIFCPCIIVEYIVALHVCICTDTYQLWRSNTNVATSAQKAIDTTRMCRIRRIYASKLIPCDGRFCKNREFLQTFTLAILITLSCDESSTCQSLPLFDTWHFFWWVPDKSLIRIR